MILSIFKINIIGTYAYFQFEVSYLYPIYIDFLASVSQLSAEADLAVGQRGQLTPWPDLVNKVACF